MSHVEIRKLKGINDTSLVWDKEIFDFTTAQFFRDFLSEFNSYVRAYRVINRDAIASLFYRQDSKTKTQIELELSSIDNQEGWVSYIEINPNAVSGVGQLEVDLVPREVAEREKNGRTSHTS